MTIHSYAVAKVLVYASVAVGAFFFMLDPTVKVALIVSIPATVTGLVTLILGIVNRQQLKAIKVDVNSNFSRLLSEKANAQSQLTESQKKLSHAEGRREGVESGEAKTDDAHRESRKLVRYLSPMPVALYLRKGSKQDSFPKGKIGESRSCYNIIP